MSSGKSSLMNTLLGRQVFEVVDGAGGLQNTTKGIDIFRSDDRIYLDCEGTFNDEGDKNKSMQMAAFVCVFSDTVLILVRREECGLDNSTYDKFVMPLFFNKLLKETQKREEYDPENLPGEESQKIKVVVVVKDLKRSIMNNETELEKIRGKVKERLEKEWESAVNILKSIDPGLTRRNLEDEFDLRVEFVEFNGEDKYERTEGISSIIANDPKSTTVLQRLAESENYAAANILGDIDAAKRELDSKKQEFQKKLESIDLLDSELEDEIEEAYRDRIQSLFCDLLYKPFERIKDDFISKAINFRWEYMRIDIKYYRFKINLCELLGTWFKKFKIGIVDRRKEEFETEMNQELNRLRFLDGSQEKLIDMIRQKIKFKMNNFSAEFTSKLSSQKIKDLAWYSFDLVTLALPGFGAATKTIPKLVSGLALSGRRAWKISRVFIGIGIHSISRIFNSGSLHLSPERQVEELEIELEVLLKEINGAKESKAVYEIDERLRGSLSTFDLENFLVPQENNQ
eukprot:CAMPEP_0202426496 /NCGR_PEP_ID=MMETSP1345-20130828/859_1 /ASSEMBLY_ACC=CAM_ASM_000843 /TAXON_ID=342563 /ORGANISM="Fabrea Fabrea salina" /LENGTH=513 /DNA_ID=CAMNT_0049036935 /DNA_START=60 /DNA_END=1601 /DNA_ORIENTATION=+